MRYRVLGKKLKEELSNLMDIHTLGRRERVRTRRLDCSSLELLTQKKEVLITQEYDPRKKRILLYKTGNNEFQRIGLNLHALSNIGNKMVYDPNAQIEGLEQRMTYGELADFFEPIYTLGHKNGKVISY